MSEYDQQQYRRMLYKLACIEDGDFSQALVADLASLLGVLETRDPAWESAFQDGLAGLDGDIFFATHKMEEDGDVSYKDPSYDEATAYRLRATAAELKQLVLQKIKMAPDGAGTE
jgi:hypothetical protein